MTRRPNMKSILNSSVSSTLFLSLLMTAGFAVPSFALPQDGQVVRGQAGITSDANSMNVTQSTDRSVINWHSFDIGANESVHFAQPSASSVTLNRVTGSQSASQILGALGANGKIILVNPQGVIIGQGARINVGSFVATTSDIDNDQFMAGQTTFDKPGNPDAKIINKGQISVVDGGLVALVGPNVSNTGLIQARLGRVHLASGDVFTIDLYGDGLITIQASPALTRELIENSGKIEADGGEIFLTAGAAKTTIDSLINMDGLLQANSVGEKAGHIILTADGGTTTVTGQINAKGQASGEKGGEIDVLGQNVTVANGAVLDASGQAGGGKILVGGAYQGAAGTLASQVTQVAETARLLANAGENGNGGTVVVWSDDQTTFAGRIEAKGGALGGNGGLVETSGTNLSATGLVDASAVFGAAGTWLLDPYNVKISTSGSGPNGMKVSTIQNSLNTGTNVTITTSTCSAGFLSCLSAIGFGDIEVANSILKSAGNDATLTLNAQNNIVIDNGVSISSTKNKLNVALNADSDNSGTGAVYMGNGASILSNGGTINLSGKSAALFGYPNGVELDGATLNAAGGDIHIAGASDALGLGLGIDIENNSVLQTSGAGTITLDTNGNGAISVGAGSKISTANGAITLSGQGRNGSQGGVTLVGAQLTSTGGNISVTGKGYGSSILGASYGVYANGSSLTTSGAGTIEIDGQGGNSGIGLAGLANYGVWTEMTTLSTTGNGAISVTGHGGNSVDLVNAQNFGVHMDGGSISSTGGSDIAVSGFGGNNTSVASFQNSGLMLTGGAAISTTTGAITLTGVSGTANYLLGSKSSGIYSWGGAQIGGKSDKGAITFIADTLDIEEAMDVQTKGTVTFKPYSANTSIGVAEASGTLQVTSAILDHVNAGKVVIGDLLKDTGTLSAGGYKWRSDVAFLSNTGSIFLTGVQKMGSHSFLAETAGGNMTIEAAGGVKSSAAGYAIVLASSHGNFTNKSGANALQTGKYGNWLIYSTNPALDTMDGLASDFHRYSCTYGGSCPALGAGNGNLYSFTPYLTITAAGAVLTYGDYYYPFVYQTTGYLAGDQAQDKLSGSIAMSSNYPYWGEPDVGTYYAQVQSASMVSSMGYGVHYNTAQSSIVVNKAPLTIVAQNAGKTYGQSDPSLLFDVNGLKYGQTSGTVLTGSLDRVAGEHVVAGGYAIGEGTLALLSKNYIITSFTGATFTINPASLIVSANNQSMGMGGPLPDLTYTYSGLVNGDNASVFSGNLATNATLASLPGPYGITRGSLTTNDDYTITTFSDATLTVTAPGDTINQSSKQSLLAPIAARGLGYRGILLALAQNPGNLGGLPTAAGGGRMMTPEELSNLAPAAGGNGNVGGAVALIECNDTTPCQVNQ